MDLVPSLVGAGLLGWLALKLIRWGVVDATWRADGIEGCRSRGGACWAFIHAKGRLILFGTYPYPEQWRAALATAIVIALFVCTAIPRFRNRFLTGAWVAGALTVVGLMRGGWFGLTIVETARWGGLPLTLVLACVGLVSAFPIGVGLALARSSPLPVLRGLAASYVELVRGVPLVTVLFMASVMFPLFLPSGWNIDKLVRAQAGIVLFAAAYLCEVVRGGLQSIPRGQIEAARSLGLDYAQTTRLVVLPQALRAVVPPMVNTAIGLFKDTSLVVVIGLLDLTNAAKTAMSDPHWMGAFLEGYVFIGAIYFGFCFALSKLSRGLESSR